MKLQEVLYFMQHIKNLEEITLDKDTLHFKYIVAQKYGELVYDGLWFTTIERSS